MNIEIDLDIQQLNSIRKALGISYEKIGDEMLANILVNDIIDRYLSIEYVDEKNLQECIEDNTPE